VYKIESSPTLKKETLILAQGVPGSIPFTGVQYNTSHFAQFLAVHTD